MHHLIPVLTVFGFLCFGCADHASNELVDYCENGGYQNCSMVDDAGDCLESVGCDHEFSSSRDTYLSKFKGNIAQDAGSYSKGYVGTIKPGCHLLNASQYGGDVDWLAFEATPGTAMRIYVEPTINSKATPVVYLRNRWGNELIFRTPNDYGQSFIDILVPDSLFYLSIEEYENYQNSYETSCRDRQMVGGEDYGYLVWVVSKKQKVVDLGTIKKTKVHEASFSSDSILHYYKFKIDGQTDVHLTLKRSDGKTYSGYPVVSPLDRNDSLDSYAGGYDWGFYGKSLDRSGETGDDAYQWHIDQKYASCSDEGCEYWIAVFDYYAFSDYSYELTIQPGS